MAMRNDSPQFWFRSSLFKIDPAEDEETNPFCYGKELAYWIRQRFIDLGYTVEDVIAEDWGWCVMLQRDPFMLWIGCGCVHHHLYAQITPEQKSSFIPNGADFTWCCVVGKDAPVWTSFFWKRLFGMATEEPTVRHAAQQLEQILQSENGLTLVEARRMQ